METNPEVIIRAELYKGKARVSAKQVFNVLVYEPAVGVHQPWYVGEARGAQLNLTIPDRREKPDGSPQLAMLLLSQGRSYLVSLVGDFSNQLLRIDLDNLENTEPQEVFGVRHFDLPVAAANANTAFVDIHSALNGGIPVTLRRTQSHQPYEAVLWKVIRERSTALGFEPYSQYIDSVFCTEQGGLKPGCAVDSFEEKKRLLGISVQGSDAYEALKLATECFLMQECATQDDNHRHLNLLAIEDLNKEQIEDLRKKYVLDVNNSIPLPYMQLIRQRLGDLPLKSGAALGIGQQGGDDENGLSCYGILRSRASCPVMIELIWSYWMEESLLVQTMNAISRRFQNVRAGKNDALARLEIDPLRPMNNLLWGYIQDEPSRLSLVRRAHEYDHHYGFSLVGRAVPKLSTADSRSRFLGAFHQLLNLAHRFFREDDDTTVIADAFPLLNALREVHLLLAEGAHNQYGDLPWVARKEMLIMQWMLARPEMREFIGGRIMVPQKELWMDRVDGMKRLQGWSGISTTHFVDLAQTGENLLLSIRFASWSQITDASVAAVWVRFWRNDIQRYAHAYRAVTGVNLAGQESADTTVDALPPSHWLRQREAS